MHLRSTLETVFAFLSGIPAKNWPDTEIQRCPLPRRPGERELRGGRDYRVEEFGRLENRALEKSGAGVRGQKSDAQKNRPPETQKNRGRESRIQEPKWIRSLESSENQQARIVGNSETKGAQKPQSRRRRPLGIRKAKDQPNRIVRTPEPGRARSGGRARVRSSREIRALGAICSANGRPPPLDSRAAG